MHGNRASAAALPFDAGRPRLAPHPAGKHISRPDAAIMDAPLWCHYRKLGLWLTLEGVLIALSVVMTRTSPVGMGSAGELTAVVVAAGW